MPASPPNPRNHDYNERSCRAGFNGIFDSMDRDSCNATGQARHPAPVVVYGKERKSLLRIIRKQYSSRSGKVGRFVRLCQLPVVGISLGTYNFGEFRRSQPGRWDSSAMSASMLGG